MISDGVQAAVNIAASRHITTTAEGVETRPQRELLQTLALPPERPIPPKRPSK
jgi:EAL domain-containing protein (putative c-di-GMP-specific phosphodiesterase class I)